MFPIEIEAHELAPAVWKTLLDEAVRRVGCRAIDGITPGQMPTRSGAIVMRKGCKERLQFSERYVIERG
ncbi:hypothetical protein D7S65_04555 [Ralstonia insidiosa]|nr:hypothetical protein [Ralstonia insidiosa]MBA9911666.1 hypothetical protein [Ralstonia insidiosa]MBA9967212.1 hypothetical protein [Ralstonia insidiosa]